MVYARVLSVLVSFCVSAGSAHPTDSYCEAVPEKAFRDTGAGAAGPQPGHSGEIYFTTKAVFTNTTLFFP